MIIDELMSLIRKGPEIMNKANGVGINTKSVARGANDSTFQFPCLIVDTAPLEMATTFAASMDRVYATFVQSWLSLHPVIDITVDRDPIQYLKKFHQNVKLESALENLVIPEDEKETYLERAYNGEYELFMNEDNTYGVMFSKALVKDMSAVMESHRDYLREYLSEFNLEPLDIHNYQDVFTEADSDFTTAGDILMNVVDGKAKNLQMKRDDRNAKIYQSLTSPKLVDRDLKRANDMMPFGVQCRMMAVNDKNEFVQYMDFIVGVKTILHLVKSDEMINNIIRTLQNQSIFFKFLRWTTGEISLFKNLMLDLDNIKFDASARGNGRSPWFSTLRRLKDHRLKFRNLSVPTVVVPNSTVVITNYEVDYIEKNTGVDVRDPNVARKIMKNMFLMTFAIIDDASRTIDIMYDGSDDYQTYALETLEREVSMNSNKLGREIGRMISR